jgi:hypothetical protein
MSFTMLLIQKATRHIITIIFVALKLFLWLNHHKTVNGCDDHPGHARGHEIILPGLQGVRLQSRL